MIFSLRSIAAVAAVVGVGLLVLFNQSSGPDVPEGIVFGNGRIEAAEVDVATKLAGRIASIDAREGDLVKAGQLLARIDSAQLEAQRLRAAADVARAESMVAQADAQIAQAAAQLKLAERVLERASDLLKRGHTSEETYDTRLSNRDVAMANLTAAKANRVSQLRSVDSAMAVQKEIETQIADCRLVAPTFGRVLYRLAEPGEVLTPGGKVITLVDFGDIYMTIFLPAAAAHRLAIGSDARIVIDGADFAVPATVTFVSPQAQFTPKQVETQSEREKLVFRVKVRVPAELVEKHVDFVKTGIRGVTYVRPGRERPAWPDWLEKRFTPPEPAKPQS
jgi:HlyD family secretion protein